MRKCLLLIILLPLRFFGQFNVYHPFADTNTVWNVCYAYFCQCQSGGNVFSDSYRYTLGGTFTFGPNTYREVYRADPSVFASQVCGGCDMPAYWGMQGGFREDIPNKKVYFKSPAAGGAVLIYDFSSQVGDTLNLAWISRNTAVNSYSCTVISIDSVQVGGSYRKRLNLSNNDKHIEGIGSIGGFLEGSKQTNSPCLPGYALLCYHYGADYYPTSNAQCTATFGISQLPNSTDDFKLFPNPAQNKITLQSDEELNTITIYSCLGEIVLMITSKNTLEKIDISTFSSGMYIIRRGNSSVKFIKTAY